MTAYADAATIAAESALPLRPPPRVRLSASVAKHMRTPMPSGGWGEYSIDQTPYMVEPMDTVASRVFEAVIFAGPAQSGKTVALIEGTIADSIAENPADCQVVQSSQLQAEDFSKFRIDRTIRNSPDLRAQKTSRASDDNVHDKSFRNGASLRIGWPSVGQLSGKAVRRMLMTDVDNYTGDLSIDEAFGMALKRIQTFMSSGIVVAESSPARDYTKRDWKPRTPHEAPPASGILALYNRGDRRRWFWPCPECKEPFQAAPGVAGFVLPSFDELQERVAIEDPLTMATRYAKLVCPSCAVPLEHRFKRAMNKAGRWVGEGQTMHADGTVTGQRVRSKTASFWLGGVAAGYQTWESLLERYFQAIKSYAATGESKTLKTTVNVDQAAPFVPMAIAAARSAEELKNRRSPLLKKGMVPRGGRFLTAQVDIQAGKAPKFVIQVQAWGPGMQTWIVDRYALKTSRRFTGELDEHGAQRFFPLDPASYLEDWARLIEKVIQRTYPLDDESGRVMRIRACGADSGGKAGVTAKAYEFVRSLKTLSLNTRFRLWKGASAKNAPIVAEHFPDASNREDRESGARGDVPVLFLNTNTLKDAVVGNAYRAVPGPGFMHFGSWLSDGWFDELTAEVREDQGWTNPQKRRNETLDLCVAAHALALSVGADRIDWSNPPGWARTWDANTDVLTAEGLPQPPPPEGTVPAVPKRPRLRAVQSSYLKGRQ
jgi:phage terminase large subunit GpA-like protein